jgi:hypothetical protein
MASLLQPEEREFRQPIPPSSLQHLPQDNEPTDKSIKVILNCFGQKELIKDAPVQFAGRNLLLVPILNHIKYLGKPIAKQSVSYFSEEDQMDVYVGIEGVSISSAKSISIDELKVDNKIKLTLNIKAPQDLSPMLKQGQGELSP